MILLTLADLAARTKLPRYDLPPAVFWFPQDEDTDNVIEVRIGSSTISDWVPAVVDYLYMSLTN